MNLIGITGRKRAGKDTAGEALEAAGFYAFAFARPIKIMLAALLDYQGVDDDTIYRMLDGDLKEVETPFLGGRTPRYAMQTLGTEWGRQLIKDSLWVDIGVGMAKACPAAVITDVRFPNEVQAIRAAGGKIIRIERPDRPVGEGEEHSSEAQIDTLDVNVTIVNNSTVDVLHAAVLGFAGENPDVQ